MSDDCIQHARDIAQRDRYHENQGDEREQAYRRGWNHGAAHVARELDARRRGAK
jgi:hypothetical protein